MSESQEEVENKLIRAAILNEEQEDESDLERNKMIRLIRHAKRISVCEKILMMLVVVGLAFMIFSAATMYFQNCWVVSTIPFYYGTIQFALTFAVFIYNIKISRVELWTYKMIGIMNVLTACINIIMYYVVFQKSVICSNAICHSNFTGQYIIDNIPSSEKICSNYDGLNSLQKSNAIFLIAEQSLQSICSNPEQLPACTPQLQGLYVFNQTGYFIGLMIVSTIFILHGGLHITHSIRIDNLKCRLNKYKQFSLQIYDGEELDQDPIPKSTFYPQKIHKK